MAAWTWERTSACLLNPFPGPKQPLPPVPALPQSRRLRAASAQSSLTPTMGQDPRQPCLWVLDKSSCCHPSWGASPTHCRGFSAQGSAQGPLPGPSEVPISPQISLNSAPEHEGLPPNPRKKVRTVGLRPGRGSPQVIGHATAPLYG